MIYKVSEETQDIDVSSWMLLINQLESTAYKVWALGKTDRFNSEGTDLAVSISAIKAIE